jgi:hypothetical protein
VSDGGHRQRECERIDEINGVGVGHLVQQLVTICSMRGAKALIRRWVKAADTSLRSRVCSGGSRCSIVLRTDASRSGGNPEYGVLPAGRRLTSRGSASAWRTASYCVTNQAGSPSGNVMRCTGACAANCAYACRRFPGCVAANTAF